MKSRKCSSVFLGLIVFFVLHTVTFAQPDPYDPGVPDSLFFEGVNTSGKVLTVPVFFFNDEELIEITVPFVLSGEASLDSVSFAGSRVEQITKSATGAVTYYKSNDVPNGEDKILFVVTTSMMEPVPPGRGLLVTLYFILPKGVLNQVTLCEIDTTSFSPDQTLAFSQIPSVDFVPQFTKLEMQTVGALAGDIDQNGVVDIEDMVFLIEYVFRTGPSPSRLDCADVNCDCKITVADVVYLINYLLKNGPAPQAGCVSARSTSNTVLFRSMD